jgi:hypothetical protein
MLDVPGCVVSDVAMAVWMCRILGLALHKLKGLRWCVDQFPFHLMSPVPAPKGSDDAVLH